METKKEIELGEEVLIDGTIRAYVDEIWSDTYFCVDLIGGEHEVTAERLDLTKTTS